MLNSITVQGRLGLDPTVRATKDGKPCVSFRIACDRDFGNKDPDWVPIVTWGNDAAFAQQFMHKGDLILVRGRLQSRQWEDKEGKKRTEWEVVADHLYFCGSKQSSGGKPGRVDAGGFEELGEDSGELPF